MKKSDFICLCSFVKTETVKKLQNEGKTLDEIQEITNLGKTCGKCLKILDN